MNQIINKVLKIFNAVISLISKKITIILSLTLAISLVLSWEGIANFYTKKKKENERKELELKVSGKRTFQQISIEDLKIKKASLESRWQNGLMYYKIYLLGEIEKEDAYKNNQIENFEPLETQFEYNIENIEKLNINLLDSDGFKIFSFQVSYSDMTKMIDNKGKIVGFSINSNLKVEAAEYNMFHNWDISYLRK